MCKEKTLSTLLNARYGEKISGDWNVPTSSSIETMLRHKSVRSFDGRPLGDGMLEVLVAAAQSGSTSSNLVLWSVVAVTDAERKKQARLLCGGQEFIERVPVFLCFCADLARITAISSQVGLPGDGIDYTELTITAVVDATIAAQNLAVAAESVGLGICYVGGARNNPRELAKLLELPDRVIVVFGLALGWPATDVVPTVRPRLAQEAVLHYETYSAERQVKPIERYNEIMRGFYDQQKMNVDGNWSLHSARRVESAKALGGDRAHLLEILRERGFGMR
jgi:nitroreductase